MSVDAAQTAEPGTGIPEHILADLHEIAKAADTIRSRTEEVGGAVGRTHAHAEHAVDDLHIIAPIISGMYDKLEGVARSVADLCVITSRVDQRLAQLEEEFGPLARKYAKLTSSPVTGFLAARKEASADGGTTVQPGRADKARSRGRNRLRG